MVYEDDSFTSASFRAAGNHARTLPARRPLVQPPKEKAYQAIWDALPEKLKQDEDVKYYFAHSEAARRHAEQRWEAVRAAERASKCTTLRDDERERVGNWFDAFVGVRASVCVHARLPQPSVAPLPDADTDATDPAGPSTASSSTTSRPKKSKVRLDHTAIAPAVPGRKRYGGFWRYTDTPDRTTLAKFGKEVMALVESTKHLLGDPQMPFELWLIYRTGKGIAGLEYRDGEVHHKTFDDITELLKTLDACFGLGHDFWACDRVSMLFLVSFLKAGCPFIWGYNGGGGEALWVAYVKETVVGLLDGSLEEEGQFLIFWLDEGAARRTGNAIGSFFLPEFGPRRLQFLRDAISCYGGVVWKAAKPEQEGSGSRGLFWANSRLIRADPQGTPRSYSDELYLVELDGGEGGDVAMEAGVGEGEGEGGPGAAGAGAGAGAAGTAGGVGGVGGAGAGDGAGPSSSAAAASSSRRGKKRPSSPGSSSKATKGAAKKATTAPNKAKKGARGVNWEERFKRCTINCEACWETEDGELVRQDDEEWLDFGVRHFFEKHWPPKMLEDGTVEDVPCPATAWEGCSKHVWKKVEKTPEGVRKHLKEAHKKCWDRLKGK